MAVRLAIVCTPRTGNTWLRTMLGDLYGIPTTAVPNPAEVDWDRLPPECVLAVHWHRTLAFLGRLRAAGLRVIVPARHPLDVLVSILQFCLRDRSTVRWLEGENGNEWSIYGAMPGSTAFLDYATGPRAASLLGVSLEWWSDPLAHRVRYEDLVADTEGELGRLAEKIGEPPRHSATQVAAGATIPQMRLRIPRAEHHFWQGQPGLWKTLLTSSVAERIGQSHSAYFAALGYRCDPDPTLTPSQADANWIRLLWSGIAEEMQRSRQTEHLLTEARQSVSGLQVQQAALQQETQRVQAAYQALAQEHQQVRAAYQAAEQERQQVRAAYQAAEQERQQVRATYRALEQEHQQVRATYQALEEDYRQRQAEQLALQQILQAARTDLAHYQELGPIALGLAWRLRDLSRRHPRVSAAAKRVGRIGYRAVRFATRALTQRLSSVRPPTTVRIAGSTQKRSGSLTSS